jgi:hypothetical protein
LRTINDVAARPFHKFWVPLFPAHVVRGAGGLGNDVQGNHRGFFRPLLLLSLLTVVAAVIIGLFNISERVRQYPNTRIERNVIATKKEPRLFMFAPKTKHGLPASKTANSASAPTARADSKKSKHCKSMAGSNGGF